MFLRSLWAEGMARHGKAWHGREGRTGYRLSEQGRKPSALMCVEVRSSGSLGAVRLQLGMQVALLRRPATLVL